MLPPFETDADTDKQPNLAPYAFDAERCRCRFAIQDDNIEGYCSLPFSRMRHRATIVVK